MHSQGEVLRPHEDRRLLVGPRARAWRKKTWLHCSWDPSHLLTTLHPVPKYTAQAMGSGRQIAAQNRVRGGAERRDAGGPWTLSCSSLQSGPLTVGQPPPPNHLEAEGGLPPREPSQRGTSGSLNPHPEEHRAPTVQALGLHWRAGDVVGGKHATGRGPHLSR